MPVFLNPAEAEAWVFVGLLIFLAIVLFGFKAHKAIFGALDAKTASIQADLDEAARIRAEAQAMLEDLKAQRQVAERQATEMLAAAEADAKRIAAAAQAAFDESLARRELLAERKIAQAEAQAATDVKAAAADLAANAAETLLQGRLKGKRSDPLVDVAVSQLAAKLS
jgi:F-type H+-transporting ATPase subunit b